MIITTATFHQVLASVNVLSCAVMFGIQIGWTAPTLVKLRDAENVATSNTELSWIASSHEIGRFLGPLLAAMVVDKIGRQLTLTICSISFFVWWLVMVFTHSIKLVCCLRMLLGATQGVTIVTSLIYASENCTPKMRGILSSIYPVYMYLGTIIEYVLATYTTFETVATVNAVIGFGGCLTNFLSKETPYFLVMKQHSEMAKKNLMWLRGKSVFDSEVELELNKISENIDIELLKKKSLVSVLTSPENYKSLSIAILLNWLFFMTGYYSITAYSSIILQSSSTFSSREYTIMLGLFPLVTCLCLPFVIERYNRRSLCLCLLFLLGSTHLCTFLLYLMEINTSGQYFSWAIFVIMAIHLTISTLLLPLTGIIPTEVLPMSVKAIGNSLGTIMSSLGTFITVAVFLPTSDAYGIEYNFLIYLIASVLLFAYILTAVPETRGKSLVDIQKSLQSKNKKPIEE